MIAYIPIAPLAPAQALTPLFAPPLLIAPLAPALAASPSFASGAPTMAASSPLALIAPKLSAHPPFAPLITLGALISDRGWVLGSLVCS